MSDSPLQAGINLGDLYNYWGTSMKKLGQIVLRALSGEHRTKWNEIMSPQQDFISNLSHRDTSLTSARNYQWRFLVRMHSRLKKQPWTKE